MADAVLKQMILDAPQQVSDIDNTLTSINDQISDFQDKQDSLSTVCNTVSGDLETYLTETKFLPAESYYMYEGENYNQYLSSAGSIIDWKIYLKLTLVNLTYVAADTFSCDGDQTSIFTEDADVSILLSEDRVYSTVLSSTYDDIKTDVVLNDEVLDETIQSVWVVEYVYISEDDPIIDDHKTNWDFCHDYIVLPLGTSGTYGTKDNMEKLNIAKVLLTANREKYNSSITILAPFV